MDYILYLLVAVVVCGIFGGVVYVLAKKENAKDEERVKSLTKEQVDTLTNTPYQAVSGLPNAALVHGLILEIPKVTSSKAELVKPSQSQSTTTNTLSPLAMCLISILAPSLIFSNNFGSKISLSVVFKK